MAKTATERAALARQRDAANGVTTLTMRVPLVMRQELLRIGAWLRETQPRELTGLVVRNRKGQVLTMALDQMPPAD
jgi:hypothetical protein